MKQSLWAVVLAAGCASAPVHSPSPPPARPATVLMDVRAVGDSVDVYVGEQRLLRAEREEAFPLLREAQDGPFCARLKLEYDGLEYGARLWNAGGLLLRLEGSHADSQWEVSTRPFLMYGRKFSLLDEDARSAYNRLVSLAYAHQCSDF